MRKFSRGPAPALLLQKSARYNRQWAKLRNSKPEAKFNWYVHQGRSVRDWIIDDLRIMTNGHCSFCDRYTVEPESVEHFRPKSIFTDQAYSWENLYFCCGGCQNFKGEKWDELLLRPDAEDFEFSQFFIYDFSSGSLEPNPTASDLNFRRAEITIVTYGLNHPSRRKFRLLELRRWQRSVSADLNDFAYRDFINPV